MKLKPQILSVFLAAVLWPSWGRAAPVCTAPVLSDQDVKAAVEKARAARSDLPAPYAKSRWVVRRDGCQYVFLEYSLPETPEANHIFRLDPYGTIVDAVSGNAAR